VKEEEKDDDTQSYGHLADEAGELDNLVEARFPWGSEREKDKV
jgi:hypothetical protein